MEYLELWVVKAQEVFLERKDNKAILDHLVYLVKVGHLEFQDGLVQKVIEEILAREETRDQLVHQEDLETLVYQERLEIRDHLALKDLLV